MSDSIKKKGKRTIPRSVYIKILVFLGLIGLSVVVMQPVYSVISDEVRRIQTELIGELEAVTGLQIHYESMRPVFLGYFEVRKISVTKDGYDLLSISQIKAFFSIRELFLKQKTFVHTIQIERPVLHIDMEKDRETIGNLFSFSDSSDFTIESLQRIAEFLPNDVNYQIKNFSFSYVDEQSEYLINNMDVVIRGSDDNLDVSAKFYAELKLAENPDRIINIKTDIEIDGNVSHNLDEGTAEISVVYLTCLEQDANRQNNSFFMSPAGNSESPNTIFTLNPVAFAFSYSKNLISLTQTEQNAPLDYFLDYNIETGSIRAELNMNNFIPANLISHSDYLNNFSELFHARITGTSSFTYDNDAGINYDIDLYGDFHNIAANSYSEAVSISAQGNENSINVGNFYLGSSVNTAVFGLFYGNLTFNGSIDFTPFVPVGTITLENFSLNGNEDINAVFNVSSQNGSIYLLGDNIDIGREQVELLDIYLYPAENYISVSLTALCKDEGQIYLDAVFDTYQPANFQMEASLNIYSLSLLTVTEIASPFIDYINTSFLDNYLQDILVEAEIFFSTDARNIVFNAPAILFDINGTHGILSLSGTDRQLILSEGIILFDESELLISANMEYSNPNDLAFSVNASYLDLRWQLEGNFFDGTTIIIQEQNGLHVYGIIANNGSISGFIEGMDFPIPVNSQVFYLNFYLTMFYNSFDFWNIDINHFSIREWDTPAGTDFFRVSGNADQDSASFRNILLNDSVGMLAGSADFTWDKDFSYLEFLLNVTDGYESGENYYIEGIIRNSYLEIHSSVSQMQLNRFLQDSGKITISADASIKWESVNAFEAKLEISSFFAELQDNSVLASVDVYFTNDELLVNNLVLEYGLLNAVIPLLNINRIEGTVGALGSFNGLILEKYLSSKIVFAATIDQFNSWFDITQSLNAFDGILRLDSIRYGDISHEPLNFAFKREHGALSVSGGINDMIRFDMDSSGNFFAGLSAPVPIRASIAGTYKDGIIDAHCSNFFIDFESLWLLVGPSTESFNISSGYITGVMDIRGHILNPEFYGWGRASSFTFQIPEYFTDDIRPVPFLIVAEGYEMTFGPVVAASGSGGAILNGWFLFEHWYPNFIGLDFNIPGNMPIPYRMNITGFLAEGSASGYLNMTINLVDLYMDLRGELFSNEAELGLNMDEINANINIEQEELDFNFIIDLTITVGSMVEFAWPSFNPILKANPVMGSVINVSFDSNSMQYSITGDVRIRSGEVYYFDRSFYIRQGILNFRENETQFEPLFTARAEIRDRTDTGPVTISMIVENQPLFSFEPRFEANPSLTQLEIYSILGQNLGSTEGVENVDIAHRFLLSSTTDILTQFITSSDILAQFVFFRQFERQVRDALGLDMFSVRTRLLQNAVVTGATGIGLTPSLIDRGSRVGNYFDNTTVFIGKYIGQDMFIQGMLTMRYDEDSVVFGGLRFEPDIGIELQSPIVNIRWDFFPSRPENYWLSDNSITLSWSRSF